MNSRGPIKSTQRTGGKKLIRKHQRDQVITEEEGDREGSSIGDTIEVQELPVRRQRIEVPTPQVSGSSPCIRAGARRPLSNDRPVRGARGVSGRRGRRQ